mmetsp:Transcript_10029/g.9969  ORF Transcript_10029/g.9969 Transcript_10029/m.9969 type:complete len:151 (-) Transcript_10029:138-590(-)|eukprot:CAMPEP_0170547418 /NCGR_PEP_ID=MMETSP0211-20121228/5819_1 /TAXON_ID=311385 /ORGANISM="Pseudokeronopsis sp., Strain OXSARD2" /LENGTH=150 /DNA_ID=CAMNT_0010852457 /DNA_START=2618 /DNA_END=3070 /DNA_ORIENTATION=+
MKGVLEEFKEREKTNEGLLSKLVRKDKEVKELRGQVEKLKYAETFVETTSRESNDKITQLKQENHYLQKQQATRVHEMESKFEKMFEEFKRTMDENKELKGQLDSQETLVKQLEKAKDNFKDQTLDLKAEIRTLKASITEKDHCVNSLKT